jgi:hypothetical protein
MPCRIERIPPGGAGPMANECVFSWRGSLCRCFITSEWNVEGGRLHVVHGWFSFFLGSSPLVFDGIDGLTGWDVVRGSM